MIQDRCQAKRPFFFLRFHKITTDHRSLVLLGMDESVHYSPHGSVRSNSISPLRRTLDYNVEEEEAFVCEGNQDPWVDDRAGSLAVECWNLHKTVLNLSCQSTRQQQDMKTQKHLQKNLQKLLHHTTEQNKARLQEITLHKRSIAELAKKLAESNSSNTMLNNAVHRYKKIASNLRDKVNLLEKDRAQLEASSAEALRKLRKESNCVESQLRQTLQLADTEQKRLVTENYSLKQLLHDATDKSEELMEHTDGLQKRMEALQVRCDDASLLINQQLEQAHQQLQAKLEKVWSARVAAGQQVWSLQQEKSQLLAFILSEGLQLPAAMQHIVHSNSSGGKGAAPQFDIMDPF
jgi:hypothetical protein